jgi:hypothetical protein
VLFLLIIFGVIGLLWWGNTMTVRLLRRRNAAVGWWMLLVILWAAGLALGIYGGFFFEFSASRTFRVLSAPVPAGMFHWEGPPGQEQWVCFPAETALLNASSNVALMPLLMACPIGLVFSSWRKLRSSDRPVAE